MGGNLRSIQALRALAATSVVVHHALLATTRAASPPPGAILPPDWLLQLGAAGVDVFFVISGFLMAMISGPYISGERPIGQFLAQRLIRIWPPYLLVTLGVCATLLWSRGAALPFDLAPHRLLSLVFVPSFNAEGRLQPIVGPGWSLNFEMLFYACFAVALAIGRHRMLLALSGIIAALYCVGLMMPAGILHAFLGDPIVFEFVIGAAIGFLVKDGVFAPSHGPVWIAVSAMLFIFLHAAGFGDVQRLVAYGLPAAALLIGCLALERRVSWPRALTFLGDASYSIYLVHIFAIPSVAHSSAFTGLGAMATLAASLTTVCIALAAGVAFHLAIERPMLRACRVALSSGVPAAGARA